MGVDRERTEYEVGRILIAYASRYGSTHEVGLRIGSVLAAAGEEVDVVDASDVGSLDDYDLAIVGSGIYVGLLRRRAIRLLHRIARQRPDLPVAAYALGPLTEESTHPQDWSDARERLDHALDAVDDLHVVDRVIFGGAIDPDRMRWMFRSLEASDLRDWEVIERWALRVANVYPRAVRTTTRRSGDRSPLALRAPIHSA